MKISSGQCLAVAATGLTGLLMSAVAYRGIEERSIAQKTIKDEFHLSESQMKKAEQMVKTDTISWEEVLKTLRINKVLKQVK